MSVLDDFRLDGHVGVITGGGRGIGEGIAFAMADAGADVVVAARREGDLARVVEGVEARGARGLAVPTDVLDRAAIERLAAAAVEAFGKITVWVNNAGGSQDRVVRDLAETPDSGLGRDDRVQPHVRLPRRARRPAPHGRGVEHHQHRLRGRPQRRPPHGGLRRRQGGRREHDHDPLARTRRAPHPRQRHRPRSHRHRAVLGHVPHDRGGAGGLRQTASRPAAWASPPTSARASSTSPRRPAPGSPARPSPSTAATSPAPSPSSTATSNQ